MADEAFALSPISARAARPSEKDYEAISEAFMETSRGRWFLGEYARRNRNADTSMVLDAVARIEETIAAQRQPAPDSGLTEALAAIASAVDEARAIASAAVNSLTLEEALAPARKGARVIREIAWRLREIGADGRICDLIDSQVSAIEGACEQIPSADTKTALSAAFDLIEARIAGSSDSDRAPPEKAVAPAHSAPSDEAHAAAEKVQVSAAATDNDEIAIGISAWPSETAPATAETPALPAEVAEADDDAVLDMVALEMAAPDAADADDNFEIDIDKIHLADLAAAGPVILAPEPELAMPRPPIAKPMPAPAPMAGVEPSLELSLGSLLIESGIVRRPNTSASDPLAPIRRMSQAEKIALFS